MPPVRSRQAVKMKNFHPHIVRKKRVSGDRWYVYDKRGGGLLMKRDGDRPSRLEILNAMLEPAPPSKVTAMPAQEPRRRGNVSHRPLFIKELVRTLADNERWVYFISDGQAIKIGAAKCVRSRLKTLKAHNPRNLEVLAMVRGGEVLESAYHALFAAHRLENEWFSIAPSILDEIERLKR